MKGTTLTRKTIHYTVELLQNGNFNIYEGDQCVRRNLKWGGVSPVGAAEALGGWVITWAQNEKEAKSKKQ